MGNRALAYGLALLIFAVDQISKAIITGPLNLRERVNGDVIGQIYVMPFFDLTWVENRGISLGLAQAQNDTHRWILVAVTAAIAIGVAWWIRKEEQRGDQVALALVLGGALGNIVDRVQLGYVIDFLDLHFGTFRPFYVFNVADAAISIGVIILLLRAFFSRDVAGKNGRPEGSNEHA